MSLSTSFCQSRPENHFAFLMSSTPFFRLPKRLPRSAVRSFLTRTLAFLSKNGVDDIKTGEPLRL